MQMIRNATYDSPCLSSTYRSLSARAMPWSSRTTRKHKYPLDMPKRSRIPTASTLGASELARTSAARSKLGGSWEKSVSLAKGWGASSKSRWQRSTRSSRNGARACARSDCGYRYHSQRATTDREQRAETPTTGVGVAPARRYRRTTRYCSRGNTSEMQRRTSPPLPSSSNSTSSRLRLCAGQLRRMRSISEELRIGEYQPNRVMSSRSWSRRWR